MELSELSEAKIFGMVYDDEDDNISRVEKKCCAVELSELIEENICETVDDDDDDDNNTYICFEKDDRCSVESP